MIIQVGQAIGVLPTIALLILDSILGAVLMRAQGRAAWRRFNAALAEGARAGARGARRRAGDRRRRAAADARASSPTSSASSSCCPRTRAIIRRLFLGRRLRATGGRGRELGRGPHGRAHGRRPQSYDVDGTATSVEPRAAAVSVDLDERRAPAAGHGFSDAVTFAFGDPSDRRVRHGPRRAGRWRGRQRPGAAVRRPRDGRGRGPRAASRWTPGRWEAVSAAGVVDDDRHAAASAGASRSAARRAAST